MEPEAAADEAAEDGAAADGTEEETREPLLDENGDPVVDAEGNPVYAEPTPPPPPPPPPISLQYLTPSGLCVQMSTERTVTQKKPEVDASPAGSGGKAATARAGGAVKFDAHETSRAVLADGSVVRHMSDGKISVMLPDGGLCERPARWTRSRVAASGSAPTSRAPLAPTGLVHGPAPRRFRASGDRTPKDEEGNVVTDEETGAPKFPPKEGKKGTCRRRR